MKSCRFSPADPVDSYGEKYNSNVQKNPHQRASYPGPSVQYPELPSPAPLSRGSR